jgi:hypothetical protein
MIDPTAVLVRRSEPSHYEVRVNFGMLSGREATPAELDELAAQLLPLLESVSIVAEHRQETDGIAEVELHQVRIDLGEDDPIDEVVAIAERWADACFASRHAEISEN